MLKKSVIISTLILSLVLLPFSSLSAFAINTIDYEDYISNIVVDGNNDIVTVTLPLDRFLHRIKTGDEPYYSYNGSTVEFDLYGSSGLFFTDQAYPLGNEYYINADDIPSGTVINYQLSINLEDSYYIRYPASLSAPNNAQVKAFAAARDNSGNLLTWNLNNTPTYLNSGELCSVSTVFNKPNGTAALQPMFQLEFYNMSGLQHNMVIEVKSVQLVMSIASLQRLQNEVGKTNKILEKILEADPDILDRADDTHSKTEENISKADEILDILDEQSFPDEHSLADSTDTFDIVTENNIMDYTQILGAILDAEIIRNMLLLAVSLALISLVLFGKKK